MTIPALILAAGASRRLGRPKQLIEFEGETLLNRTIRLARGAGADPVFLVLGAHFEEIRRTVPLQQVALVHNDEWKTGMASSIRAGLRALALGAPAAKGVMLLTCDQPRLSVVHLRDLLEPYTEKKAPIMASTYGGTRGTPAVFPREVFGRLSALEGDKGARSILVHPPCALIEVEFPGGEVDIDVPADLGHLE